MPDSKINVGIADMKMARQEGVLITHALGSCVGICIYDSNIKLGALIHIMLPEANGAAGNLYKFADTGIRETLRKMSIFGGIKGNYICKIAGGAKMFEVSGGSSLGSIGDRNVENVKKILQLEGIKIASQDTGKNYARTMYMDVSTGEVGIRTSSGQEYKL